MQKPIPHTAPAALAAKIDEARALLARLSGELDALAERGENSPNWGYCGDAGRICQLLAEALGRQ